MSSIAASCAIAAAVIAIAAARSRFATVRRAGILAAFGVVVAGLGSAYAATALADRPGFAAVLLGVVLVAIGGYTVFAVESSMKATVGTLADKLRTAAAMDFRQIGRAGAPDGQVAADALSDLVEALRAEALRVGRVAGDAVNDARNIRDSAGALSAEAPRRNERLASLATHMTALREAIETVTRDLDRVAGAATSCAAVTREADASVVEVVHGVERLGGLVEQVTSWVFENASTALSVATSVDSLATAAVETSKAMTQMDATIRAVEHNADETAKVSLLVQKDAETGVESVNQTIAGIERIREDSLAVAGVVGSLGKRAEEIGDVVTVIDEVAEQTNLLALNAAIIAGQAGEHGRSFAVVADEIKELAEKTSASAKEIQELIRAVQEETANAVKVIERGKKSVSEGVALSERAGAALAKIQDSVHSSTRMAQEIARSTAEQAKVTQGVATSMGRIAKMVEGINSDTVSRVQSGEKLERIADDLKMLTSDLRNTARAGGRKGAEVSRVAGDLVSEARRLDGVLRTRAAEADGATHLIRELLGDSGVDVRAKTLESSARDLEGHLRIVAWELERFFDRSPEEQANKGGNGRPAAS